MCTVNPDDLAKLRTKLAEHAPGPKAPEVPAEFRTGTASAPSAERQLTFGEKAVGISFNPGNNAEVESIKRKFADLIDELHNLRVAGGGVNERSRMLSIAITEAQAAQMWAVKAVTWQH